MLAETSALISSIATIKDLSSALFNERDRQKAASIQMDLTDKVLQAQAQLSQVLATVIEKDRLIQSLSERIRQLEGEQSEKARYRLSKVGTEGDFFAYALRPMSELRERADEPPHFVCQPCLDVRQHKSILRLNGLTARCYECNTNVRIGPLPDTGVLGGGSWMGS